MYSPSSAPHKSHKNAAPTTGAWGPILARLTFGVGLAAAVVVLGPAAWRLGQKAPSARPAAREHAAPARSVGKPQPKLVAEAMAGQGEGVAHLPAPPPGGGEEEHAPDTERLEGSDVPRSLPDGFQADAVFEQRLGAPEEDLRAQLCAVPEVRLLSDGDVLKARRDERAAQEQLVEAARAAWEAARANADAANARMNAISAELNVNRNDLGLASAVREAAVAASEAARTFGAARAAYTRAVSRTAHEREQISYDTDVRLHQTLKRSAGQAGFPLRSGPTCQLEPSTAVEVAHLSQDLRNLGFVSIPGVVSTKRFAGGGVVKELADGAALVSGRVPRIVLDGARGMTVSNQHILSPDGTDITSRDSGNTAEAARQTARELQTWCDQQHVERKSGTVPTLAQMLQIEDEPIRLLLVRELRRIPGADATTQLAVRAIVDLSPAVRQAALAGLERRPWGQYSSVLLRGLRYPWPPVADHAAAALRTLGPPEAIAPLVELLDLPSPSAPVLDSRTNQYLVREVVRVNHLRNCLLCHAPSANTKDGQVRGLVPTPGEALPVQYYESQDGHFVRADITFLRQDFSVNLPAEEAGPWPRRQRYDFVTRLSTLSPGEGTDLSTSGPYPQRDAVLYALRGLTGKDGGASSARWRELLGLTAGGPSGGQERPALETTAVSLAGADRPR